MTQQSAPPPTSKPSNVIWGIGVVVAFGAIIWLSSRI